MYGPGLFSPVTLGGVVLNILCSQSFHLELVQICTCGNTNIILIFVWSVHPKNSVFLVSAVCSVRMRQFLFCFCFVWQLLFLSECLLLWLYVLCFIININHWLLQMVDIFCLGVVVLLSIHPDVLVPPQNQAGRGPEFDGIFVDDLERELQAARPAHTITKGLWVFPWVLSQVYRLIQLLFVPKAHWFKVIKLKTCKKNTKNIAV